MPTVILLDNSLSMCRQIKSTRTEPTTFRDLSHLIIKHLVDHISSNEKMEYLALVTFSSTAQVVTDFTREHDKITKALESIRIGDCARLEEGLNKVSDLVIGEWACFTNVEVLLLTDDQDSLHYGSLKNMCARLRENQLILKDYYLSNGIDFDQRVHFNSILNEDILKSAYFANLENKNYYNLNYPFSFPNKFDIICLSGYVPSDTNNQEDLIKFDENCNKPEALVQFNDSSSYIGFEDERFLVKKWHLNQKRKVHHLNELIDLNNSSGHLYVTTNGEQIYEKNFWCHIFKDMFKVHACKLKCGHLESSILLEPAPLAYKGYQNYCYVEKTMSRNFETCGFINIAELTTPPTISRHLVLPNVVMKSNSSEKNEMDVKREDDVDDLENANSFLVLLHASLKSEGMAAIVYLDNEWYGAIHAWHDNKNVEKKSNLMLTVFVPGTDVIQNIIQKANQNSKVSAQPGGVPKTLPVVKSYTKGCIVWYRPENLVSDLQKIIRNAKKMHDKMPIFYKELNKVRKAALSFGFYELFEGLAQMLQRELTNPSNMNNQDMMVQLNHCIFCLRAPEFKEYRKDIQPFVTNPMYSRKAQK